MAFQNANKFRVLLGATVAPADGTITLAAGEGPNLAAKLVSAISASDPVRLTIDDGTNFEIVEATSRTGDILTVTRGVDGTSAQTFGDTASARVFCAPTRDVIDSKAAKADNLDQFADVSHTAGQTLTISSSTTLSGGTHSGTNTGDQTLYNQTIEDEGTPLTQRGTVNFVGGGVTVTDNAGKTEVSIPGGGGGDVSGPASAVNNNVAFFDGTTGKLIKDSGLTISGTNTGDQTSIVGITGTTAQFNTALTDGDFATGGGTATGTNTGDQTVTNSSDATSHTVTLSASGGSIKLIEGSNITLTTAGTAADGEVTIASTGGGGITIGDTITSSTVGSVLFVGGSNDLQQDNANFFWNDTSNRLGIGTSTPLQPLHVSGTAAFTALTTNNFAATPPSGGAFIGGQTNIGSNSGGHRLNVFNTGTAVARFEGTGVDTQVIFGQGSSSGQYGLIGWDYDASVEANRKFIIESSKSTVHLAIQAGIIHTGGQFLTGIGAQSPDTKLEVEEVELVSASTGDEYSGTLTLDPGYTCDTAAVTLDRHNYIDIQDVSSVGTNPATITDSCVFRFDAAAGTHKATVGTGGGVAVTIGDGPSGVAAGNPTAWIKVNINGTIHYIPTWS